MASINGSSVQALSSKIIIVNVLWCCVAYIAVRILYQIIYYRWFHPLSKFPGPFWASVTRLYVAYYNFTGAEPYKQYELHKKYGPVMRIAPTLLLVNDASALPDVYHRQANKSNHYGAGVFGKIDTVFSTQDWRQHVHIRKTVAGPYSFTNIKKMEPLIDATVHSWINKLEATFAATGQQFDFAPWAVYMAYDTISELGFGAPFGFVETGSDVGGLIKGFHDGLPALGVISRLHPFVSWFRKTWIGEKFLVATPKSNSGIGALLRFRDKLLAQRLKDIEEEKTNGRVDLLQTLLEGRDADGQPMSMDRIKVELLLIMIAGADTTGTAIGSMLVYVLSNSSVYSKLMEELDAATRAGSLSHMPQHSEVIEHCPYYVACVRESMRLCPSVPTILPRDVSKGGIEVDGKFIPEGTEISCNPWVVHRDENIYGKDAGIFRPERWLDAEAAKKYHKYNMAFGYGGRVCLGKDLALMELYKGPLQFFRTFRPEFQNQAKPGEFIVKGGLGCWKDIWLKIERRADVV